MLLVRKKYEEELEQIRLNKLDQLEKELSIKRLRQPKVEEVPDDEEWKNPYNCPH
jgi:hypothetical protein